MSATARVAQLPATTALQQVLPTQGEVQHSVASKRASFVGRETRTRLSFLQALGALGPLLLLVDLLCIVWTACLIVVNASPNATANYLTDTGAFDGGNFWLIVDAASGVRALGLAGLIIVEVGYIYVCLKMLIWRDFEAKAVQSFRTQLQLWGSARNVFVWVPNKWRAMQALWNDLTGYNGSKRKYWVSVGERFGILLCSSHACTSRLTQRCLLLPLRISASRSSICRFKRSLKFRCSKQALPFSCNTSTQR